jgi:hypothetical protein
VQKKLQVPLKAKGSFRPGSRERAKMEEGKSGKMSGNDRSVSLRESRQERFEECELN